MKKLLTILIGLLLLTACAYEYQQYDRLQRAFVTGCTYKTIESSLNTEGSTITLIATCQKAK